MECVRLNEGEIDSRNKWIKTRKSAHSSEIVSVASNEQYPEWRDTVYSGQTLSLCVEHFSLGHPKHIHKMHSRNETFVLSIAK